MKTPPPRKPRARGAGPRRPTRSGPAPRSRPSAGAKPVSPPQAPSPPQEVLAEEDRDRERMDAYLLGQITLGDLEGVGKARQYEIAQVGHAALVGGKLDTARTIFEGLLALDPFDAYFLSALGSVAQQKDELEEADRRYSRALEINPFSTFALAHRGEIRVTQGRLEEGVDDLVRAIQEDPNAQDPAVRRAQATVAIIVQQLEEAGHEVPALKAQSKTPPTAPVTRPGQPALSKPKVPKIDPETLAKFAASNEVVVTRRRKKGDGPQTEVVPVAPPKKDDEES